MNKGLTITLITLLSILLIGVVGIMIFLFRGDIDLSKVAMSFGESKTLIDEKEINNIKPLNIETNRSDITVETKDEYINSIKVELYSDYAEEYEITENENEIKVILKDKKMVSFSTKASKVKIYVPSTYDKDITVNGKTGDVELGYLSNSNANITLTTGDVVIKDIKNADINGTTGDIIVKKANDLNVSLTTGDVEIGKANKVDVSATTGDIDVDYANDVKVKLTTGDITLGTINNYINLKSTTGDIKVSTANLNKNSKIDNGTGDIKINSTSGCYVEAKTKIGDTNVDNNDRKSDITLTINSRIGDIKVN